MRSPLVPVHPAGWPFIILFGVVTAGLWFLWLPLGIVGIILTLWCIYFFRNPERAIPADPSAIICPADGVVQLIETATIPEELSIGGASRLRVSIFMNVFNVHVNRAPVAGRIAELAYRPGKFFNASLDKASEFNERQSIHLVTADGQEFVVVQIAGLIARRIKCYLSVDQTVAAGERFGLIRFGSRVDVYLPAGIEPLVKIGQKTVAGETIIAKMMPNSPSAPSTDKSSEISGGPQEPE